MPLDPPSISDAAVLARMGRIGPAPLLGPPGGAEHAAPTAPQFPAFPSFTPSPGAAPLEVLHAVPTVVPIFHVEPEAAPRGNGAHAPWAPLLPEAPLRNAYNVERYAEGLNDEQRYGLDYVLTHLRDGRTLRLSGPAGTGKTYLTERIVAALAEQGTDSTLVAPTGRAALRMQEVLSRSATTIHSAIYGKAEEDLEGKPIFSNIKSITEAGVVLIDESSMIGVKLSTDLDTATPSNVSRLYLGDHEQLPPVNEPPGIDLANAEVKLTQVMRQASDSPILALATAIRTGQPNQGCPDDRLRFNGPSSWEGPVNWLVQRRLAGEDAYLTTWANETRKFLNARVREQLGLAAQGWLVPGDLLLVRRNSMTTGLLNGEVLRVEEVTPLRIFDEPVSEVVLRELMPTRRFNGTTAADGRIVATIIHRTFGQDTKQNAIIRREITQRILPLLRSHEHAAAKQGRLPERYQFEEKLLKRSILADIGQALTCHALQGSQVAHIGFAMDGKMRWLQRKDPDTYRRLCYTAVTRAVETLNLWTLA